MSFRDLTKKYTLEELLERFGKEARLEDVVKVLKKEEKKED